VEVLPNATVEIEGDPIICEPGQGRIHLIANVNDTNALVDGYTYEWRLFNATLNGFTTTTLDTVLDPSDNPYIFTILVHNANGCSTVSEPFYVYVNEAPEVTVTAAEVDYCVGGQTELVAHLGDYNSPNLTYQWLHNGDSIIGATEFNYITPANLIGGTHNYSVIVTQTTSGCVAEGQIVINIHADPVIDNITVSNAVICDGGQVIVTAHTALNDILGDYTYTWYRNGVLVDGVTENTFTDYPVVVDNDVTTYTYSAIVTQNASGCTSLEVAASVVTVNPHPTVVVVADGSLTVCEGGVVRLNANVDPADDYTYQWYLDNQPAGYDTNLYVVAGLAARETSYQYYVVVESQPGCISTSAVVNVNVVPDPVVTITGTATDVCEGGVATLTAAFEGGVPQANGLGTHTYTWYNNGVEVGTGVTYQIPDTLPIGQYSYSVLLSFADYTYGCDVNSAIQGGNGIYAFNVVADPEPLIVVTVGYDSTICQGGSTQLSVHHINGGTGNEIAYQWYRDGVILAGETNPTLNTDASLAAADYTYQVHVTMNGIACDGWSNTIIVPVVDVPSVEISGTSNVCVNGQISLTAIVDTTYGANVTYQWNRVIDGIAHVINGATSSTYTTDTLLTAGTYQYNVTISNPISGCTFTSGVVVANVIADPTVAILGAEDVCQGGSVELTAVVTETVTGVDYQYTWYRNDVVVGSNSNVYVTDTILVPGNYYYRVEITPLDLTGCDAISAVVAANVITRPTVTISGYDAVCEGGSVVLNANVQPTGTYNYIWYRDNVELNTQNISTVTTDATLTAGTYHYSVVVWNNNYDVTCTATAQFEYTVVADPTIDSILTSLPDNQMCVGGNVTLTASMSNGLNAQGTNVQYHWTRNGSVLTNAVGDEITENLTVAGRYTYTVYATQSHNGYNTGCQSVPETIVIEVLEQPYVAITYEGLLDVCEGGFVELSAVIEGGVNDTTIRWRKNGALMRNYDDQISILTDTNTLVGTYTYAVTVSYPAVTGCRSTSDNVVVNVVYNPRWLETVVEYPDVCVDDIVTLHASVEGGVTDPNGQTGAYIQWVYTSVDSNDVTLVTGGLGGNSYDIATTPGIYYYYPTYIAPSNTNCVPSNVPNSSLVSVHAHPTAAMSLSNGSDVLCWNNNDDQAAIHITFTGTAPFHFFIQDLNTNVITEHTTFLNQYTIYVNPNATTTYQLFQLSDRYCEGDAVNTPAVTIVVSHFELVEDSLAVCPTDNNPMVTFTFNNLTIDDTRDSIWFEIIDYNNIGFDYQFGLLNLQDNTAQIYMPTSVPGTYQFSIAIDGCEYDVTVVVLWGDLAGSIIDQKWDDVVLCNNNPATNGGHTFVSYQWYRNGMPIPGATHQYYQEVGGLNGVYSLWVMDNNGNVYMTCEVIYASNVGMRVYPVPAHTSDEITIELPLSIEEIDGAILDIFDAKGALVRHINIDNQVTKLAGFETQGAYFGRITTATNDIKTVKFIIVK
ncbi:MAG TPA: T9SS type A sorting domain-containing protein, partial [Bacteroidales bacterium]|nr:T9SS type A sorting domain-containing protein [Bacteroidales bacterium]